MLLDILLLVVGLVILTLGADKFVEGASSLAKKFNVSDLAIGLTVVAFGTSAPELIVNVFAAIQGNNGIAYGNIIGSNSFNLMLILGIAGMIYPLTAHPNIVKKDTGYSLLAAILVFVLVNDQLLWGIAPATEGFNNYPASAPILDKTGANIGTTYFGGIMSRLDAGILLIFFGYFLYYVFKNTSADQGEEGEEGVKELSPGITALYTIGGLAGLVIGGKLIVDSAVSMAQAWGMTEKMIGLTIVSAGTSLPELATSCIAAYRKKSDIAIANVIGSNIFNIFFILAASATIAPIPFEAAALNIDIYVLMAATVVFFAFLFMSKPVEMAEKGEDGKPLMGRVFQRWQGFVFLVAYIGYTIYLIKRG